jgi:vitamin B12 transporter
MSVILNLPPRMAAILPALLLSPGLALGDTMEPVLVTATRTAIPTSEALASVEVIPREELERLPAADIADALRLHSGLEIARTGGPGQQTSLFIRGSESNHSLVLVDGVRINPGTIGSAALQNISPDLVERIEVVKGPRSTLYGSDAIGGVVNVITRRAEESRVELEMGGGSYGTRTARISAAAAGEPGALAFGAAWLDSAGFPTRTGDTIDRGYRNLSLSGSARTRIGGVSLGLRAWRASGTSEYSDFFVTPVDQDFVTSAFALDAAGRPTQSWRTRGMLSLATDEIAQNQSPDFLRTRRWQADWQNDLSLGEHHLLTAGLLLQREDAASESFGIGFDTTADMRLAYLQDQFSYGRHQALVAVGFTDHDAFGGHLTWNAEYGLAFSEATAAWISAGTAFRAPDATDRFGYGGNPDLAPESSRAVELGLRHRIGERHALSLVAFRNDIDDLIQFVVTDFSTFQGENRNVERARIQGIEASWQHVRGPWLARLGLTLQDPRDLTGDTRLLRRARENVTFALSRRIGEHQVALDVLAAGERHDFGFPEPVRLEGYVLASLSARIRLNERWLAIARLENLFDEQYELARGFNTMDRSLFVSLRREFR